jgi:heme/copper-type cytochrome/quinol oxidase subunit 3
MSAVATEVARPDELEIDHGRGTRGMILFIVTEAMLFVSLFFAYFLLGSRQPRWPMDAPPKLGYAFAMLVVLLASSGVMLWAERLTRRGRQALARVGVWGTIVLGALFLGLQSMEYRERLRTVTPRTDAYGSIFYAITGIHGFHLLVGLAMLLYVAVLPDIGPGSKPPHRPLFDTGLYWHFVDLTWAVIVVLLYVLPNLRA